MMKHGILIINLLLGFVTLAAGWERCEAINADSLYHYYFTHYLSNTPDTFSLLWGDTVSATRIYTYQITGGTLGSILGSLSLNGASGLYLIGANDSLKNTGTGWNTHYIRVDSVLHNTTGKVKIGQSGDSVIINNVVTFNKNSIKIASDSICGKVYFNNVPSYRLYVAGLDDTKDVVVATAERVCILWDSLKPDSIIFRTSCVNSSHVFTAFYLTGNVNYMIIKRP